MKKVISLLAVCLIVTSMTFASANAAEKMGLKVGVEGAFVLPLSDWADVTGIGLGGMAKLSYCLNDAMSLNLRAGYIFHLTKEIAGSDVSTSELPILVGFRYTAPMGLFGDLALGLVNFGAEVETPLGDFSDSEMKFGAMAGAGYAFSGLSISANLFIPSLPDLDEAIGLLFLVGYDFAAF